MNVMEDGVLELPKQEEVLAELNRVTKRREFRNTLLSTVATLVVVAAIAVLISTLYLPVLRVYGEIMEPALNNGEILVALREKDFQPGDVVAFYYHNKVLLKRVVAKAGDYVNITEDGLVYINIEVLEEPYIEDYALGICDIELPYQVPDGRLFVLGDHRSKSVDSS